MYSIRIIAAGAAALMLAAPAFARDIDAAEVDAQAQRAMSALGPTGMTVTVIEHGKVVLAKGYGLKEFGEPAKVDANTMFPIASLSKAFTTASLAMLVDEGKLAWDDPVRKYIPDFAMSDPWVSEHFTIRDMLTHRSGLPLGAGDLLFWPAADPSAHDVIGALKYLKPETGFRSKFAYDNLMYIVAGEVVRVVSGKTWQDFVETRLMQPIGMKACVPDPADAPKNADRVEQHARAPGSNAPRVLDRKLEFSGADASAGGVQCSANAIAKWAQFWLDDGKLPDGTRLISEEQMRQLWTAVTPLSPPGELRKAGATHLRAYGLGWFLQDFRGKLMVSHSGGSAGAITKFLLFPELDAAVFVSVNEYMSAAHPLAYQLADEIVSDGAPHDWIDDGAKAMAKKNAKAVAAAAVEPPAGAAAPSLNLAAYAGTYRDPWYGDVVVRERKNGLAIDMTRSPYLKGPLAAFDGDVFIARWPDRTLDADAFATFEVKDGKVVGMTMKAVSDTTDFSYDFHDLDLKRVE